MTDPSSKRRWPEYLPLPSDDIFALGVIALNYCQLENMFRLALSKVAMWNEFQTAAVFHRLANNTRLDILSELLAKRALPKEAKELVQHFAKGFGQCAENRNLIMHSSSGGMHRSTSGAGLVLERYSKNGNRLTCYLTARDLQRVADEIHQFMSFGSLVVTEITNYETHLRAGHPEDFRLLPSSLRKKPPLPAALNWRPRQDRKEHHIPPAASILISPHRRLDE